MFIKLYNKKYSSKHTYLEFTRNSGGGARGTGVVIEFRESRDMVKFGK